MISNSGSDDHDSLLISGAQFYPNLNTNVMQNSFILTSSSSSSSMSSQPGANGTNQLINLNQLTAIMNESPLNNVIPAAISSAYSNCYDPNFAPMSGSVLLDLNNPNNLTSA